MSFVDISPPNQPFNHAFRPFSLQWEEKEETVLCTIIYGFGEYQFSANLASHDSKADLLCLRSNLASGNPFNVTVHFVTSEDNMLLQLRGQREICFFSWLQEKAEEQKCVLEGETNREYLLSLISSLEKS